MNAETTYVVTFTRTDGSFGWYTFSTQEEAEAAFDNGLSEKTIYAGQLVALEVTTLAMAREIQAGLNE